MGLIIGAMIKVFFTERKYLTNFSFDNSQLEISYLTSLLKAKKYRLHLTDITNLKLKKANRLLGHSAVLKIRDKDKWTKFYLMDKKIKVAIQSRGEAITQIIAVDGDK